MEITAAKPIKNFGMEEAHQKLRLALVTVKDLAEKVLAARIMIIRSVHILKDVMISVKVSSLVESGFFRLLVSRWREIYSFLGI